MYYFIANEEENEQLHTIAVDGFPAISVLKLLALFVSANSSAESLEEIGGEVVVKSS